MAAMPFRRLAREVLVDNAWHRYCRDRYTQADGSEGEYFYIDMPGSCGIVPRFADGTTALLRVHRYLLDTTVWEFPIGGMKDGEDPLEVAKKELEEEAGLIAERWTPIGTFAPYKGVSNERCHFFLAEELSFTRQDLEPSESITVHRMPFADARRTLLDQELPDGQSLAGLALFDAFASTRA
jgi:ADP-ribose pyrophosphatase